MRSDMVALASIAPAAIITIVAIVLIVAAIVVFLLAIIVELKTISNGLDVVIPPVAELVQKTQPVNQLVHQIVSDLGAGTNLLEGLLVKKAGMDDAAGLIESLFPGGGQAFLARNGRPGRPRHFGVVYSRGALQLARLGRGSPLGAALRGSPLRDPVAASESSRALYPDPRGVGPTGNSAGAPDRPRTPVIGANSPNQYRRPGDDSVIYDSSTDAGASPRTAGALEASSSFKTGGPSRFAYATQGTEPDPSAAAPTAGISAATAAPNRFGAAPAPPRGGAAPAPDAPNRFFGGQEPAPEPATPEPTTPPADSDDVIHYRR
jgi:hypothetical protein